MFKVVTILFLAFWSFSIPCFKGCGILLLVPMFLFSANLLRKELMTVRRETTSPNLDAVTLNVRSVHQLLLFRCDSVSFSVVARN